MNYSSLVPLIAVSALGAPQPLVIAKIAETAEEFFRLTRAYEIETGPTALVAGQTTTPIVIPADTYLLEVNSVRVNGVPLRYRPEDQLVANWEALTGEPTNYLVKVGAIRLLPYPVGSTSSTVRLKFSVAPLLSARALDDAVVNAYQAALMHGAKARLLANKKDDWADPVAAGIAHAEYLRLVNEARIRVRNQGTTEVDLHVRTRFL